MLVSSVSLFSNSKNYNGTNFKKHISFGATTKGTGKIIDGAKKATGTVRERVRSGNISEHTKKLLQAFDEAEKRGELRPDTRQERLPGMPLSD